MKTKIQQEACLMKWLVYNDCESSHLPYNYQYSSYNGHKQRRKVFKICFNKKIFLILSTSIIILSPQSSTMSNKNTYLKRSSWRQNAQCQSGTLILLYICSVVQLLIILIAYQQGLFLAVWHIYPKGGI